MFGALFKPRVGNTNNRVFQACASGPKSCKAKKKYVYGGDSTYFIYCRFYKRESGTSLFILKLF